MDTCFFFFKNLLCTVVFMHFRHKSIRTLAMLLAAFLASSIIQTGSASGAVGKISVTAPSSVTVLKYASVTVKISPAKIRVVVLNINGKKLASGRTTKQGTIVFVWQPTAAGTVKLSATAQKSGKAAALKSKDLRVTVRPITSTIEVESDGWPMSQTWNQSSSYVTATAYFGSSNSTSAGRNVTLQFWDNSQKIWKNGDSGYTDAFGEVHLKLSTSANEQLNTALANAAAALTLSTSANEQLNTALANAAAALTAANAAYDTAQSASAGAASALTTANACDVNHVAGFDGLVFKFRFSLAPTDTISGATSDVADVQFNCPSAVSIATPGWPSTLMWNEPGSYVTAFVTPNNSQRINSGRKVSLEHWNVDHWSADAFGYTDAQGTVRFQIDTSGALEDGSDACEANNSDQYDGAEYRFRFELEGTPVYNQAFSSATIITFNCKHAATLDVSPDQTSLDLANSDTLSVGVTAITNSTDFTITEMICVDSDTDCADYSNWTDNNTVSNSDLDSDNFITFENSLDVGTYLVRYELHTNDTHENYISETYTIYVENSDYYYY